MTKPKLLTDEQLQAYWIQVRPRALGCWDPNAIARAQQKADMAWIVKWLRERADLAGAMAADENPRIREISATTVAALTHAANQLEAELAEKEG